MTTIIIFAVVAIIVIWAVSVQRNLVGKEENRKNAMSQIGVQQASRWDALKALADIIAQRCRIQELPEGFHNNQGEKDRRGCTVA